MNYLLKNDFYRACVFLFFCLGSRTLLAYIAYKYIKYTIIKYLLILFTVTASIIWLYYYFIKDKTFSRLSGKVWWNNMRIIHSILYLTFAGLVITNKKWAWKLLALDVLIGFIGWILHRILKYTI